MFHAKKYSWPTYKLKWSQFEQIDSANSVTKTEINIEIE